MSGALPYKHQSPREHPSLIESRCPLCNQFIAASKDPKLLAWAESRHECMRSLIETKKPPRCEQP